MTLYKIGSKGEVVRQIQIAMHLFPDGNFGTETRDAVIAFQRTNGLKPDGIVGVATFTKLLGLKLLPKSRRIINEIIVHCSATPEGKDYSVADIRKWHKQQGWSDIGYHYVVYRDGTIRDGRDVNVSGAHCVNHNAHSIGVCYIGGVASDGKTPKDTRTPSQRIALKQLLTELLMLYPNARIYGHHDFDKGKACPSFDARNEYKALS